MKIQAERPDELTATQTSADRNRNRTEPTPQSDRPKTSDRIDVSPDALLLNSAVRAAQEAPEVRPAVVERARMKMLSGELGNDAERLADRLIDHMLKL
jgi:flagellar biosynthesis anti-sigma factor FlgM